MSSTTNWLENILDAPIDLVYLRWPQSLSLTIKKTKIYVKAVLEIIENITVIEFNRALNQRQQKNQRQQNHIISLRTYYSHFIDSGVLNEDIFLFKQEISTDFDKEKELIKMLFLSVESYLREQELMIQLDLENLLLIIDLSKDIRNFKLSIYSDSPKKVSLEIEDDIRIMNLPYSIFTDEMFSIQRTEKDGDNLIIYSYPQLKPNSFFGNKIDRINSQWDRVITAIWKVSLFICDYGWVEEISGTNMLKGIFEKDNLVYTDNIGNVFEKLRYIVETKSYIDDTKRQRELLLLYRDLEFLTSLIQRIPIIPQSRSIGELYFNIISITELLMQTGYTKKFETSLRAVLYIKKELNILSGSEAFTKLLSSYEIRNKYAHGKQYQSEPRDKTYDSIHKCINIVLEIIHKIFRNLNIPSQFENRSLFAKPITEETQDSLLFHLNT